MCYACKTQPLTARKTQAFEMRATEIEAHKNRNKEPGLIHLRATGGRSTLVTVINGKHGFLFREARAAPLVSAGFL